MIDTLNNTTDSRLRYRSPEVKVIEVKTQGVLCGSLDGTPSNNPWTPGSESIIGFGDDDE